MPIQQSRRHIFFVPGWLKRAVDRHDRFSLGLWDGWPLANPTANELAGLITKFHANPAIDPEL